MSKLIANWWHRLTADDWPHGAKIGHTFSSPEMSKPLPRPAEPLSGIERTLGAAQ